MRPKHFPSLRTTTLAALFALPSLAQSPDPFAENVRTTPALSPGEQQKRFHLPAGFEITLVAAEPAIGKPMNMAFDAKGRLWITDTLEYPFPKKSGEPGRDTIRVLEDTNHDGRADKITTFADGLNIPIGIYPYKNGVIAYSHPSISFFQDTDGDGKADKADALYTGFGNRDTHGMTNSFRRGFDGWLYATHGFNNESNIVSRDGASTLKLNSGNVYRMYVDGSRLQQFAWGPVNPFGATFDSLGNFFISDCHSWPLLNVLRGAWYPHFGNPHDGLGFGPPMMSHTHNSTGLDAACLYEAEQFPPEYRGNLFVGNVVTSRVNRDVLVDEGSTRIAKEQPDFLTCDDPWFRPVDIQLGPDGALYVADFYNRIIGHYEVPLTHPGRDRERARIWKITYKSGSGTAAPTVDLATASGEVLVKRLGDQNIKVRFLAADQLSDRIGPSAISLLKKATISPTNANQKTHALWLLHRMGALDPAALSAATKDGDRVVRTHAMRILSETPNISSDQRELLLTGLNDADALVRRCAADALGVHVHATQVKPLLKALATSVPANDTHLKHTLRMAIRNTFRDLPDSLATLSVSELNVEERSQLATIAVAVNSAQAGAFLLADLRTRSIGSSDVTTNPQALKHIARYGDVTEIEALVTLARDADKERLPRRLADAQAIADGLSQRGAPFPKSLRTWATDTGTKLLASPPKEARQAAPLLRGVTDLARTLKLTTLQEPLASLLVNKSADATARGAAAKLLIEFNPQQYVTTVARIVSDGSEPIPVRDAAAMALADANSPASRALLLSAIPQAPRTLQVKLAQGLASSPEGAETLLKTVEAGVVSSRLLLETPVVDRLKATKPSDWESRVAMLTKGLSAISDDLQKIIDQRRTQYRASGANAEAGALVFARSCVVCHSLDGAGGNVAPQLDGIGARGLDRVVEDLLDPNRNVDPAFYQSTLTLKGNDFYDGLFRREEGEQLVFADATGKETRFNKADIRKRVESKRSLMPDNLHEALSEEEFNHLLAFLLSKGSKPQ